MAESSVSSKTFSIADFEGSVGGGLTSVGWSAMLTVSERNERLWAGRSWAGFAVGNGNRWRWIRGHWRNNIGVRDLTRFMPLTAESWNKCRSQRQGVESRGSGFLSNTGRCLIEAPSAVDPLHVKAPELARMERKFNNQVRNASSGFLVLDNFPFYELSAEAFKRQGKRVCEQKSIKWQKHRGAVIHWYSSSSSDKRHLSEPSSVSILKRSSDVTNCRAEFKHVFILPVKAPQLALIPPTRHFCIMIPSVAT